MEVFDWLKSLPKNPIYRRERGDWGRPNNYYNTLLRYSPLVVIGVVILGFCGGFNNVTLFGSSGSEELFLLYCLICLPNVGMNMVTLYGVVMAPALTAPSVNQEQVTGSWDMLLVTPQSNRSILGAKLLGAMSRLKIWLLLLVLSLLNGFLSVFIVLTALNENNSIVSILTVPSAILRPFVEVFFAAVLGLVMSTMIRTATTALAMTYAGIFFTRLFNNALLWSSIFVNFLNESTAFWVSNALVPVTYLILIGGCLFLLNHRADNISSMT